MCFSKRLLSISVLLGLGCSPQNQDQSRVVIDFDKDLFSKVSSQAVISPTTPTSDDGPDWGLSDPVSLADIDCLAVFVGGPEADLSHSYCTNSSNTKIMNFGQRAGLFALGQRAELFVPAGSGRRFFLMGFASSDGSCESGFDQSSKLNFSNYSNPFLIGVSPLVDLNRAENFVPIPLINRFEASNKINDCNFFEERNPAPTLVFFQSKRSIWIRNNPVPRRVEVQHSGISMSCQVFGGGISNLSCESPNANTVIWRAADYTKPHQITVTYADGKQEIVSFTPSVQFPGLSFVDCNHTITSSTTFAGLSSLSLAANDTICVQPGVEISSSPSPTTLSYSIPITFISRQNLSNQLARIKQNDDYTTFHLSSGGNLRLIGFDLESACENADDLILNGGLHLIEDSSLTNVGSAPISKHSISLQGGAVLAFRHSEMKTVHLMDAIKVIDSGSNISIDNSFIRSSGIALTLASNSTASVIKSTIMADGALSNPQNYILKMWGGSTFATINDSYLLDGSGRGVDIEAGSATNAELTLNNNTIVRLNRWGTNETFIKSATSTVGAERILSDLNGNFFCSEVAATTFLGMTDGNQDNSAANNFVETDQENGTTVSFNVCPLDILNYISQFP